MVELNDTSDRYEKVSTITVSLQDALQRLKSAVTAANSLPPSTSLEERRAKEADVCKQARSAYKIFLELVIFRESVVDAECAALKNALQIAGAAVQGDMRFKKSIQDKLEEVSDRTKLRRYTERISLEE